MNEIDHNSDNTENTLMHRRSRHYIDALVQGRLFWAMLFLEILLFAGSLIWLYQDFGAVIEANLYRIHYSSNESGASLFSVLWKIIPIVVLFNILAIWLADIVWRRYIKHIVRTLEKFIYQAAELDLRAVPMAVHVEHEVINKARLWQQHERQRYREIQKGVAALTSDLSKQSGLSAHETDENNKVYDALIQLKKLVY